MIAGRTDAPAACQQPDFTDRQNIVFRIPTPTFGLGLIEALSDATLRTNLTPARSPASAGRRRISRCFCSRATVAAANDPGPSILDQAAFLRLLAPPSPAASTPSTDCGKALFNVSGCAVCHTPSLDDANLYSDLALHRKGQALNGGLTADQKQELLNFLRSL